jgi:hypothetical protein
MARLTKLRAHQTRASERYDTEEENLATDQEVEQRVRKHSALFHGFRDDNTHFDFDTSGNLAQIITQDPTDTNLYKQSDFTFDTSGNLTQIIKEIWDHEGQSYVKMQKDFIFDSNGNLIEIQNRII